MAVRKGEAWGEPGQLPPDGVVARSDREVREIVQAARRAGQTPPPVGLLGGDLARTLGATGDGDRLRSSAAMRFAVDVGAALIDGRLHWFVAHLVVRSRLWTRAVLAMNAEFLGAWDAAPRAHPGDGQLDVLDARLGLGDVLKVRSRLPTGAHLPHPGIAVRRTAAEQFELPRPLPVFLDGEPAGRARTLSVRVEPGALTVHV